MDADVCIRLGFELVHVTGLYIDIKLYHLTTKRTLTKPSSPKIWIIHLKDLLYFIIYLPTHVLSSALQRCKTYPPAQERQSSINDVDLPLWWQNKFQLQPCEIGFPWSIRGLRIVERFHASAQVPFFFTATATSGRGTRSLLLLSSNTSFSGSLMKSISHFGQMCFLW